MQRPGDRDEGDVPHPQPIWVEEIESMPYVPAFSGKFVCGISLEKDSEFWKLVIMVDDKSQVHADVIAKVGYKTCGRGVDALEKWRYRVVLLDMPVTRPRRLLVRPLFEHGRHHNNGLAPRWTVVIAALNLGHRAHAKIAIAKH
eukprot:4035890-Prymnesium_polylepis.1